MALTPQSVQEPPKTAARLKIGVVMPAYNAERTLERTFLDLPHDMISEVILVDDGSRDRTVEVAKRLGKLPVSIFVHKQNYGYGANQKTCYTEALKKDLDVIVMVHPDYQYDPKLLPDVVAPILDGRADVVFGSRMQKRGDALKQGMPLWKYVPNIVLTGLENLVFGLRLSEYHTGYRAFHRRVLQSVHYHANADSFIFDQQIVSQIVDRRFRIAEVYVPAKYFPEASSASFVASCIYGLNILALLCEFILYRLRLATPARFLDHVDRYHRVQ